MALKLVDVELQLVGLDRQIIDGQRSLGVGVIHRSLESLTGLFRTLVHLVELVSGLAQELHESKSAHKWEDSLECAAET